MKSLASVTLFGILCVWLLNAPAVFGAATLGYWTDQILIQPKAGISRAALTTFHCVNPFVIQAVNPRQLLLAP